jgi:uncharacterized OB-fold protein
MTTTQADRLAPWTSRTLLPWPEEERPFWTGGEEGVLRVQRCGDCGHWLYPPGVVCPMCLSGTLTYEAVSGRGQVHSFTVNHQPWAPHLPVPYVLAAVHLDEMEGLRIITDIVGCDVAEVRIGMRVEVVFEHVPPETWLPLFAPEGRPATREGDSA